LKQDLVINKEKPMEKSVPTDQEAYLAADKKDSPARFDLPFRAGEILIVLNRTINWLTGFIQLTAEEQREAGIYHGDHRRD
jgi:hypothetical protein